MARSIQDIQDQIVATQQTYFPALTSTSKVSLFRLLAYIFAVGAHIVETLLDVHKQEVQDLLDNRQPATRAWYAAKVKLFQLGDNIDATGNYPTVNPAKQIISRVSVKETDKGEVVIKVAKGTVGNEEALSSAEQLNLDAYIDKVKYAGTKTQVVSLNSDFLNLEAEVFYDPIYTEQDIQARLIAELHTFMSTLEFDGIIRRNELIDKIREVKGVNDIDFTRMEGQAGSIVTPITRNYEMTSGYVKENVTNYPFNASFIYTPEEL